MHFCRQSKKQDLGNFEHRQKLLLKNRPSTQFLRDYRFGLNAKLDSYEMASNERLKLNHFEKNDDLGSDIHAFPAPKQRPSKPGKIELPLRQDKIRNEITLSVLKEQRRYDQPVKPDKDGPSSVKMFSTKKIGTYMTKPCNDTVVTSDPEFNPDSKKP